MVQQLTLDKETIEALLAKDKSTGNPTRHPAPEQTGPLRWFDREMRCAERGCGSSTYAKVEGIPRCMMHALRRLNIMLVERGCV